MNDRDYISSPTSQFKRPMDVVTANGIAAAEKLIILRAWKTDERALQRAETEVNCPDFLGGCFV
jgi:hypothetical protein